MKSSNLYSKLFKLTATLAVALCLTTHVRADNAAAIADYITKTTHGDLKATASGNTVTVTGTLLGVSSSGNYLTLNIDAGVTVVWQATLIGSPAGGSALINLSGGAGTFRVESGSIENAGNGRAITNNSIGVVHISGDAKIAAKAAATIYLANFGTATEPRLVITGGTVENTGENTFVIAFTIMNYSSGSVIVSGGTVNGTKGVAISASRGTVNISGNAKITSACTGSSATISMSDGTLNITGGTVENTSSGFAINASANISGGTVKSESGNAIIIEFNKRVNISGGTVLANGKEIAAIRVSRGTLTITGGTISAIERNGYSIHNGGTLILGGAPDITHRILTNPDRLSVLTEGATAFAPGRKMYLLDFRPADYAAYKVAVTNGRNFLRNFTLFNPDWALTTSAANLAIVPALRVSFNLNGGEGNVPSTIGIAQGNNLFRKPSTDEFTRAGHHNDGDWYMDAAGNKKFEFGVDGTTVMEHMTLYLKWLPGFRANLSGSGVNWGNVSAAPSTPISTPTSTTTGATTTTESGTATGATTTTTTTVSGTATSAETNTTRTTGADAGTSVPPTPPTTGATASVSIEDNPATLYLYRERKLLGGILTTRYDVILDNIAVARTNNNWKTTVKVTTSGTKTVSATIDGRKAEVQVNFAAGGVYYIRCDIDSKTIDTGKTDKNGKKVTELQETPILQLVDKSVGEGEFNKIK